MKNILTDKEKVTNTGDKPKILKRVGVSFEEIGVELRATYVLLENDGMVKETGVIKRYITTIIESQLAKIEILGMLRDWYKCDVLHETV